MRVKAGRIHGEEKEGEYTGENKEDEDDENEYGQLYGQLDANRKDRYVQTEARGAVEGPALNPRRQCDVEGERGYNDTNESFNEGHVKESNDYTKVVNDALNKFPFCNFSTTLFGSGPNEVITYDISYVTYVYTLSFFDTFLVACS